MVSVYEPLVLMTAQTIRSLGAKCAQYNPMYARQVIAFIESHAEV